MHCDLEILEDLVLNKLTSNSNIDSVNVLEDWIAITKNYKAKFPGTLLKTISNHQTEFLSNHIQTKKSGDLLSSNNLYNLYYTIEDSAKRVVKNFVIKMLNETNKN